MLTLGWSLESNEELLPTSIGQNMAEAKSEERHTLMSVSGAHPDQVDISLLLSLTRVTS